MSYYDPLANEANQVDLAALNDELYLPSAEHWDNPSSNVEGLAGTMVAHLTESSGQDTAFPSVGDGWGDDLDLVDIEETPNDEAAFRVVESSEHCRKVSQGQRCSDALSLGFDPSQMDTWTPQAGCGGGLRQSLVASPGPLQQIAESTIKTEVEEGACWSRSHYRLFIYCTLFY